VVKPRWHHSCGDWNSDLQEYEGNIVVFASLVGVRSA